ncbi:MAG TPA: hypothetical protein VFO69_12395 [Allosphingosinicella sp.]|nr:hypothetical protein [Allosphingosinicella sp.]
MTAAAISPMDQAGRLKLLGLVAALMIMPVIVLRAIAGHEWDPGDVVFLGILFAGITIALEVAARIPDRRAYGAGLGLAVLAGLAQIWVNLAVGIIGSEDNPINLIYAAVIAVAVIAAVSFGLRAEGMAKAMVAAALAQSATFLVAFAAGFGFTGPITIFFVSLWLISAWLFRRAERGRPI